MKFKFTCTICKKEVKRGGKNRIEIDQYDSESSLWGVVYEDGICNQCAKKVSNKIDSMSK